MIQKLNIPRSIAALALVGNLLLAAAAVAQTAESPKVDLKYSFGASAEPGFTRVTTDTKYTQELGYGFDLESRPQAVGRVTGGSRPFFFSAKLAPGVYKVAVTLGGEASASQTTIKSESRRLMVEAFKTTAGESKTVEFLVHIRVPQIPGGSIVRMKPRENELNRIFIKWDKEMEVTFLELDWDEKLTLEFSDERPALHSIHITSFEKPVTVYLCGDSTMTDQMMEPWGAWGQQIPRFFKPPVAIANYAQSGETAASFFGEQRWAKVMSEIRAGDYVFLQFGINDRTAPDEQFKASFVRFIDEARAKGAIPVLVTSQNLRRLTPEGKGTNTLGTKPEVMRQVAKEKEAILIDLNEMSARLYEAIGVADLPKAFVDGTHQNMYGSYVLAKCVVQGIIDAKLPWAQYVVDDWKTFDPSNPDKVADFRLPPDPQLDPARPGGPGLPGARAGRGTVTIPATQPGR